MFYIIFKTSINTVEYEAPLWPLKATVAVALRAVVTRSVAITARCRIPLDNLTFSHRLHYLGDANASPAEVKVGACVQPLPLNEGCS